MCNKLIYTFLLCFCLAGKGFAYVREPIGGDSKDEGKGIGFKIGYDYQKSSYLEAGVLFHHWKGFGAPMGFRGIVAGGECRLGGSKFYCGPKISVEAAALFLGGRASLTYLTDFDHGTVIFAPEIGLSLAGTLYVYAGYNWNVSNRDFLDVTGFKISAGINFYALGFWNEHKL